MAKKPSIATLVGGYASASRLNTIFQQILDAFDNTVSRDGSTPNTMSADLDMNNNDLLNVKEVRATKLYAGGTQVTDATYVPNWEGEWTTATAYVVNDTVRNDGNVYICLVAHTSGTFSTDLGAGKWELFASKGSTGAGSGDMLAANNLSDLADAAASRTNLGISIGNDVQAHSTKLSALDALTWAANKILLFTGAGTVSTLDFKDEDDMASDSDTAVPSQQSVKAFLGVANAPGTKAALNAAGSAPIYACRAWVNFNGTGTVAIRASGNVSSITDNGAGDYTVNFSTAMPDTDYAAVAQAGDTSAVATFGSESTLGKTYAAGSYRFVLNRTDGAALDRAYVSVAIFR